MTDARLIVMGCLIDDLQKQVAMLAVELNQQQKPAPAAVVSNRPKLNKREVTAIRAMSRSGETNRSIADIYQVNPSTVSRIIRGVYWK